MNDKSIYAVRVSPYGTGGAAVTLEVGTHSLRLFTREAVPWDPDEATRYAEQTADLLRVLIDAIVRRAGTRGDGR